MVFDARAVFVWVVGGNARGVGIGALCDHEPVVVLQIFLGRLAGIGGLFKVIGGDNGSCDDAGAALRDCGLRRQC